MEPAWKLKLDSDEVIMADDTTRDLSSLMSKIKQTTEFQKQHSNTSNIEDNNDVSSTKRSFILEDWRLIINGIGMNDLSRKRNVQSSKMKIVSSF